MWFEVILKDAEVDIISMLLVDDIGRDRYGRHLRPLVPLRAFLPENGGVGGGVNYIVYQSSISLTDVLHCLQLMIVPNFVIMIAS